MTLCFLSFRGVQVSHADWQFELGCNFGEVWWYYKTSFLTKYVARPNKGHFEAQLFGCFKICTKAKIEIIDTPQSIHQKKKVGLNFTKVWLRRFHWSISIKNYHTEFPRINFTAISPNQFSESKKLKYIISVTYEKCIWINFRSEPSNGTSNLDLQLQTKQKVKKIQHYLLLFAS